MSNSNKPLHTCGGDPRAYIEEHVFNDNLRMHIIIIYTTEWCPRGGRFDFGLYRKNTSE